MRNLNICVHSKVELKTVLSMLISQSAGKFLKRKNSIEVGTESIDFTLPVVMGVVNITPDSFYDGGKLENEDELLAAVEEMINEGILPKELDNRPIKGKI